MSEPRIESLRSLIKEHNSMTGSQLGRRRWMVIGLVIFVCCYMTFITISLTRAFTPETVSELVLGAVSMNGPEMRTKMIKAAEDAIPEVIDQGVKQVYMTIPEISRAMLHQVDLLVPEMPEDFYQALAKDMNQRFKDCDNIVESLTEKIDNKEKRSELIREMAANIEKQIEEFMPVADAEHMKLQKKLNDFFTKPHHELTKEEQKIKEIMVYFLYLIKNQDVLGV